MHAQIRFLCSVLLLALIPLAHADGPFRELKHFALGGDGGWDLLTTDSADHRLYIARSNRVMVIDTQSGKLVGEVQGLEKAHGVALVKSLGRGFASSGATGEVVAFDLKTLQTLGRVKTGDNPDVVIYDAFSNRILAFNGKSHDVAAVNPETLKVEGRLALAGKPELAASDEAGHVFVNLEDKSALVRFDSKQLKILATYPLAPCDEPTGLALDRGSKRLIIGCGNRKAVTMDAVSGKVLQNFPVGDGVDGAGFDPVHKFAFVSAGEGFLTVLGKSKSGFKSLQTLSTRKSARTLAVDETTGYVYLPFAQFAPAKTATPDQPHPKPSVLPGTFEVLVVGH